MKRWFSEKFDHLLSWAYTRRIYGPRCPDYDKECYSCEAWHLHDELFNEDWP
jgi:hypothetical protein